MKQMRRLIAIKQQLIAQMLYENEISRVILLKVPHVTVNINIVLFFFIHFKLVVDLLLGRIESLTAESDKEQLNLERMKQQNQSYFTSQAPIIRQLCIRLMEAKENLRRFVCRPSFGFLV